MKNKTEKFGWVNELGGKSTLGFYSITEAARNGINKNPGKVRYIYVVSSYGRYVGMAEGILFNGDKIVS